MGLSSTVVSVTTRVIFLGLLVLCIKQYRQLRGHHSHAHLETMCKLSVQLDNSSKEVLLPLRVAPEHMAPQCAPLEQSTAAIEAPVLSTAKVTVGWLRWLSSLGSLLHVHLRVKSRAAKSQETTPAETLASLHSRLFASKGSCPSCWASGCHPGSWPFNTVLASLEPLPRTQCLPAPPMGLLQQALDHGVQDCTPSTILPPATGSAPPACPPIPAEVQAAQQPSQDLNPPRQQGWCATMRAPGAACLPWEVPPVLVDPYVCMKAACTVPDLVDILACMPDPAHVALALAQAPADITADSLQPNEVELAGWGSPAPTLYDQAQCPAAPPSTCEVASQPVPKSTPLSAPWPLLSFLLPHISSLGWIMVYSGVIMFLHNLITKSIERQIESHISKALSEVTSSQEIGAQAVIDQRLADLKADVQAAQAQAVSLLVQHAMDMAQTKNNYQACMDQWLATANNLVRELEEHKSQAATKDEMLAELEEEVEAGGQEIIDLQNQLRISKDQVSSGRSLMDSLQCQLQSAEEQLAHLERSLAQVVKDLVQTQRTVEARDEEILMYRTNIIGVKEQLDWLRENLLESRSQQLEASQAGQAAQVASLVTEVQQYHAALGEFCKEARVVSADTDTELHILRNAKHKDVVVVDQFKVKRSKLVEEHLAVVKEAAVLTAGGCAECDKRKEAAALVTSSSDVSAASPAAFSRSFSFRG